MTNYTKDAIDFAFENKLSDMQSAIQDAIKSKISSALADKKIEVAQSMFGEQVLESYDDEDDDVARADRELARMKAKPIKAARGVDPEKDMTKLAKKTKEPDEVDEELKGSQHKLDKNKNGKVDSHDFKLLRKESKELEEKLSVSDGIETWISDFVHSDDPRFEGKSKKERIKMAQGAYYAAKRANEAAEQIDESYTVSPENKSYDDDGEESVWHVVSHKGNTIGTIGTNFPKHQEKHGKWDFEDQAGNSRKKNEPMLNSKKEALNAFINRHKSMLNQSKKGTNEAAEELDELSIPTMGSYMQKSIQQTMSGKKNRTPGMQTAYKKMTTKSPIQTENPTDKLTNNESSNIGWMLKANPELNKKIELAKKKRAERKQLPVPSDSYMKSKDDKK